MPIPTRIHDLRNVDDETIENIIHHNEIPIVQFSDEDEYDDDVLGRINRLCERHGSKIHVRFFGHYFVDFDCRSLRHLPKVRSLSIDNLMRVKHIEELGELRYLEKLHFDVYQNPEDGLLEMSSLRSLRQLVLGENKKRNVNLAPLAGFKELENLSIAGQSRNIDVLKDNQKITRLVLQRMGHKVNLRFVPTMTHLCTLALWLGQRANVNEASHHGLIRLEIIQVRGFNDLHLDAFPSVEHLHISDQLQIQTLHLDTKDHRLRHLKIMTCKQLTHLYGIEFQDRLEYLHIWKSDIDADALIGKLPKGVRKVRIAGYTVKRDLAIQKRLDVIGYASADYFEEYDYEKIR